MLSHSQAWLRASHPFKLLPLFLGQALFICIQNLTCLALFGYSRLWRFGFQGLSSFPKWPLKVHGLHPAFDRLSGIGLLASFNVLGVRLMPESESPAAATRKDHAGKTILCRMPPDAAGRG